jgi:UDP-2,3-diacylglucosamine hydrolase
VPAAVRLDAPAAWQAIDFISDLHLDAGTARSFDAFATHLLHTEADAVFILGDLFEVWIGDDARGGESERRCIDVMLQASRQRRLFFMAGNRDFLVGAQMLADCGAVPLADPTLLVAWGQRVLLSHGDALCLDDVDYQRFRAQVRGQRWQADFLALPLAERAAQAAAMRAASQARKRGLPDPALWADVDSAAALQWLADADASVLVHGHTHRPGTHQLDAGHIRHVLSDWDLDGDAPRAEVLRLTPAGFARVSPQPAPRSAGPGAV